MSYASAARLVSEIRSLRESLQISTRVEIPNDPVKFAADVGIPDLDDWQEEVLTSEHQRKILLCSRRAGKTTVAALLALHKALTEPSATILIVAPSEDQAKECFRMAKGFYAKIFPSSKLPSQTQRGMEFPNRSRIIVRAAVERTTRGYSVDLLIVDEAAQVDDETYYGALRPSLLRSRGDQILLSTPRGRRGFFSDIWHGEGDFAHIKVTAFEASIPPEDLERERLTIPDFWFRQEYLVEFLDAEMQIYPTDAVNAAIGADIDIIDIGEP